MHAAAMNAPTPFSRIVSGTVLIAIITLLVRAVSFGREMMIANIFGVGAPLDMFLVAFLAPSFFIFAIAGCAGAALIPIIVATRQQGGEAAVCTLIAGVNGSALVIFTVIAALIAFFAQYYLPLIAANMQQQQIALAHRWILLLSLLIPVYGFAALWTAIANSRGLLAIPAAAPVLTPLVSIAMLLWLGESGDAWALVLGLMLGGALELSLLGWLLHRHRLLIRPVIGWRRIGNFERSLATLFASSAILGLIPLISQSMAAIAEPGGITRFTFGARLVSLLGSLGALALGYSALPVFSSMAAGENWRPIRALLTRAIVFLLAISIPVCGMAAWFSRDIVQLVYEHGNFSPSETSPIAMIQAILILQIPFFLCWTVLSSVLSAMRRQFIQLSIVMCATILNIGLNWWLMAGLGVNGIAIATTVTIFVLFAVASVITFRDLNTKISRQT